MEVNGQQLAPPAVPAVKNPGADYIGGWLGPGAGLDFRVREKCRGAAVQPVMLAAVRNRVQNTYRKSRSKTEDREPQ